MMDSTMPRHENDPTYPVTPGRTTQYDVSTKYLHHQWCNHHPCTAISCPSKSSDPNLLLLRKSCSAYVTPLKWPLCQVTEDSLLRYVLTLFSLCCCWQVSIDSGFMIWLCCSAEETALQDQHKCPYPARPSGPSESVWVSLGFTHRMRVRDTYPQVLVGLKSTI